jgi:hypothetical protein
LFALAPKKRCQLSGLASVGDFMGSPRCAMPNVQGNRRVALTVASKKACAGASG